MKTSPSTLAEFLRRLSAPGVDLSTAAVKAPLPVPGGTEHMWLISPRCEGDEFVGAVDNEPGAATGVRSGEIMRVRQSEISDWKLVENGQMIGGFTIRYFLSLMPAARRESIVASVLVHKPLRGRHQCREPESPWWTALAHGAPSSSATRRLQQ
jgi:uncharacterized protein YegJ (DUF2314 family)